ncbi:hypothetical protein L3X38_030033 [Prunus dulcis]|uniref:SHSP domain-containing protein n=1 Tax=Prunus dulcis TaxID=3755 RepID=A0AAD4VSS4_PRUDU|nr:hypothetical protein L3X38_030033 [Prunus dulcis]
MENNAGAEPQRIYEDFEPYCKWNKPADTVEIHLPAGFRKEHLKVQTNNVGILTIHGERPLSLMNTWSRFHKEIKLADKNCDPNEVRAKLAGEVLTVTMPQKVSNVHISNPPPKNTTTSTQKEKQVVPADHLQQDKTTIKDQRSDYNNNNNNGCKGQRTSSCGTNTALLSRSKLVGKDVALKLGVAVAVAVVVVAFGFGAYVVKYYKHGHPYSYSY